MVANVESKFKQDTNGLNIVERGRIRMHNYCDSQKSNQSTMPLRLCSLTYPKSNISLQPVLDADENKGVKGPYVHTGHPCCREEQIHAQLRRRAGADISCYPFA
jgi:hypothetical protein